MVTEHIEVQGPSSILEAEAPEAPYTVAEVRSFRLHDTSENPISVLLRPERYDTLHTIGTETGVTSDGSYTEALVE